MRGNDLVFAFPSLLIAIMITAVFGPSALNAIIAIGIFNVPVFARLTRGAALSLWTRDFVLAARVAGKGPARISVEHILPNLTNLLIVQGTIQFSLGILAEAGLSYVGLGAQPPTPVLGADAGREPDDDRLRAASRAGPGPRHRADRARAQPDGRRAARPDRPAAAAGAGVTGARLFLVAGEPSGDLLGGALIAGLRQLCGDGLALDGVGGPAMAAEGLASRFPMAGALGDGHGRGAAAAAEPAPPHPRDRRCGRRRWRRTRSSPSTARTSRCAWRGGRAGCGRA